MLCPEEINLFADRFFALSGERGRIAVPSATGASDAFLALSMALRGGADGGPCVVLAVTQGLPSADRLAADVELLAGGEATVCEYPSDTVKDDGASAGSRAAAAGVLAEWSLYRKPCVIVAPYSALRTPCAPPGKSLRVFPGGIKFGELSSALDSMGYKRVAVVESEGEWTARGGLIDAWSPGAQAPVRIDFFGDELEGVRMFDPATQRSTAKISETVFIPARAPDSGDGVTLEDLLPGGWSLLAVDSAAYPPDDMPRGSGLSVFTGEPSPSDARRVEFLALALPGFGELDQAKAHHPEFFEEARARLASHLEAARSRGEIVISIDDLSGGFELPPDGAFKGLAVVAKSDRVFTRRITRTPRRTAPQGERLSSFDELEPGELVVHIDYGVGRFTGSALITTAGHTEEVYTIEYADGAKLHVPACHAHLLTRYIGVKGREAVLNSLDGKRWNNAREKTERAVADLAASLLETQAKREAMPGFVYDIDCEGKDAFYAAFPYEETPDQIAAIKAVESDMAAPKPMDRLICGDAGFGKTEVAMRAAYIAAMNGRQTALIAPTTVLAEQHYETFVSRFYGTPVRIEPVSRFQTRAETESTFSRLASGGCDIVIGTHALLSHKIAFRNLGLVVIDEEQRFGVRHKEFLKRIRTEADVLTLSATPIPRTLYMSMTGAKDFSLLNTPPRLRTSVETIVARDDDSLVRESIRAELARGGLVFCLHNRVFSMPAVEKRLRALVPEARIALAHGRMDPDTLASRMKSFESGRCNVLLSTSIVESGIDIPRANTIIVFDAQMFGLADLYQLRGRVGRSSVRGRAVFLLPAHGPVESDARERLAALKRHGSAGAGYSIAMRDLELRGAGNLLGAKQSGHIVSVGFVLYCRLLRRAIARLNGTSVPEATEVRLSLDYIDLSSGGEGAAAASIPYFYISESSLRIFFMRKIAEASSLEEVDGIREELADRFGPPPDAARRLLSLAALKIFCAEAGIGSIDSKGARAYLRRLKTDELERVHDYDSDKPDRRIAELVGVVKEIRRARAFPR